MKQRLTPNINFPKRSRYNNNRSITIKDTKTGNTGASYYNLEDITIGAKPALKIVYFNITYKQDLNKNICIESKKRPGSLYSGFNPFGFINTNDLIDRIGKLNRRKIYKSLSGISPSHREY